MNTEIKIDEEFSRIAPKLTEEEDRQLEENLLRDGCREPLSLWGDILVDGHIRYRKCKKHGIEFGTVNIQLNSRDEAREWIVNNQLGRRNLPDFQRAELVMPLEPFYAEKARERQLKGVKGDLKANLPEGGQTRDVMAKKAGVTPRTYSKAKEISVKASEKQKDDLRKGKITIHKVYSKLQKEEARKAEYIRLKNAPQHESKLKIDLVLGNCIDVMKTMAANSIGLCVTDPPYLEQYVYLYALMYDQLARLLIPGGMLVVYASDYWFDLTYTPALKHFKHFYNFHSINLPACARIRTKKIYAGAKTIMVFSKGEPKKTGWVNNVLNFSKKSKSHRDDAWEQPVEDALMFIDKYSNKGDTVLDPFLGSGTVGVAARGLGRNFTGIEISEKELEMANLRINTTKDGSLVDYKKKIKEDRQRKLLKQKQS